MSNFQYMQSSFYFPFINWTKQNVNSGFHLLSNLSSHLIAPLLKISSQFMMQNKSSSYPEPHK